MAASRGALTPADARQLAHAAQLLQQRDPASALKIVQEIATRAPASADAFHLLALCEKNLGRRDAAAAAFEIGVPAGAAEEAELEGPAVFTA